MGKQGKLTPTESTTPTKPTKQMISLSRDELLKVWGLCDAMGIAKVSKAVRIIGSTK
jgi:hypothetical protein